MLVELMCFLLLTMCRERRILSAPDRARHQPLRGIPCHQAPRSMAVPDIRLFPQFSSPKQPGCGEIAIDRNMYELFVPL